ncbi:MAG TPA: type II toxin-antitoxin system HicA family toxin [Tepidisphaeraceae bacterium]|jgi:predicted RNA binding protein YcfA (HicA-like mRNA interferase family)|nr:type II toxin-antitoxin system HicA family toxin [Tepidisphaeraceae bacterium]
MRVRAVIQMVEADGWAQVGQKGSHRQYRHPTKPGRVTIPGNLGDDVKPGTLNSIKRQAGLK